MHGYLIVDIPSDQNIYFGLKYKNVSNTHTHTHTHTHTYIYI